MHRTWTDAGRTRVRIWAALTLGRYYTRTLRVTEGQSVVRSGSFRWLNSVSRTGPICASPGAWCQ